MASLKKIYTQYLAKLNKYWVVVIIFAVITFTVGDSNLYKRYMYDEKIRVLEKEIKFYQKEIAVNRQKLDDLNTSKERLERFAREEYYMKEQNEDVFIIED